MNRGASYSTRLRKLRAAWRDTRLLIGQFRWPLFAFCAAIAGGGLLYDFLSQKAGEPPYNLAEAVYQVLSLTFLQPAGAFPHAWYLEIFYFIMPVIGIGILAQGVADFGVLFFNRQARGREWEMAVAAMYNEHVILIGLGHLGYRVVDHLRQMGQDVVVIELNPAAHLVEAARKLDVPVLQEDGTHGATLLAAGVERARALILCTQNDSLNLQMAVKARSLNPDIRVIVRIFDDDFAQALHDQFGFSAFSATGMAAPAFAAAAAGTDVAYPLTIEGETLHLARLCVAPGSRLEGLEVAQVESRYNLSVVLLRAAGETDLHPAPGLLLPAGAVIAVLGGPEEIRRITNDNQVRGRA